MHGHLFRTSSAGERVRIDRPAERSAKRSAGAAVLSVRRHRLEIEPSPFVGSMRRLLRGGELWTARESKVGSGKNRGDLLANVFYPYREKEPDDLHRKAKKRDVRPSEISRGKAGKLYYIALVIIMWLAPPKPLGERNQERTQKRKKIVAGIPMVRVSE